MNGLLLTYSLSAHLMYQFFNRKCGGSSHSGSCYKIFYIIFTSYRVGERGELISLIDKHYPLEKGLWTRLI